MACACQLATARARPIQTVHCGGMQKKKVFWEEGQRWVILKLSAAAMRTIRKKGLSTVAKENNIDLSKLPYRDASEARLQWKAAQPKRPPMPKNPRCAPLHVWALHVCLDPHASSRCATQEECVCVASARQFPVFSMLFFLSGRILPRSQSGALDNLCLALSAGASSLSLSLASVSFHPLFLRP